MRDRAERAALLTGREDDFTMVVTIAYTGPRWGEIIGLVMNVPLFRASAGTRTPLAGLPRHGPVGGGGGGGSVKRGGSVYRRS